MIGYKLLLNNELPSSNPDTTFPSQMGDNGREFQTAPESFSVCRYRNARRSNMQCEATAE
jgi:hypothetical protein